MANPATEWDIETEEFVVRPAGIMDGSFEFDRIVRKPPRELVMDLARVRHANSSLVVPWLACFRKLRDAGTRVRFVNLPEALIPTFNIVEGFACGGIVVSAIAPFYCRKCAVCWNLPIPTISLEMALEACQGQTCERCRGKVHLDDRPESFFKFLTTQGKP